MSLPPFLSEPLKALLKTLLSGATGYIFVYANKHGLHISRSAIAQALIFIAGVFTFVVHLHGVGPFVGARVKKLEELTQRILGSAGLAALEKELPAAIGKLDVLVAHHAAQTAAANSSASTAGSTQPATSTATRPAATT